MSDLVEALGEPYRLVCPVCGSHTLRRNQGNAPQSHGRSAAIGRPNLHCVECGRNHTEVYDKKLGHNVSV